MRKNIIILINVTLFAFFLSSCGNSNEEEIEQINLTEDIVFNNVSEVSESTTQLNHVKVIDIGELDVYRSYLDYGILVVTDSQNQKGVWSLLEDKLIIPLQPDVNIAVWVDNVFGAYIKVFYTYCEIAIYDINGYEVLKKDDYVIADVGGSKEAIHDSEGIIQDYIYYETVTSLTQAEKDEGTLEPTVVTSKVNVNTKQRELIRLTRDYYAGNNIDQFDLGKYGLEGYYAKIIEKIIYVYEKDTDKLIQKLLYPNSSFRTIFGGHIFLQSSYQVDRYATEFSFIDNGYKYQLRTTSINLLTGEEKVIDVNYKITSINPFQDENKIYNYGHIELKKISSKILFSNDSYESIINTNGKIVADVTGDNFNSLLRLDDSHIFDNQKYLMLDNELNPLFVVPTSSSIVYSEGIIIFRDKGLYGAIDYDGKVVIPFEYEYLSPNFYDGKTYGRGLNNINQLINLDNTTNIIEGSYEYITKGLLLIYNRNLERNLYEGEIINYDGEIIATVEYNKPYIEYYPGVVENAFGTYKIMRFPGEGGFIYISILLNN